MPKATTTKNNDAASKGFQGEVMLICPDHVQAVERAWYQYEQYKAGSELPDMAVGIDFMLAEDKPYRLKNRTAIIPVHGLLLHRLSWHIPGFMTGYDYITSLIDMAEEDEDVDRIAFDFNTGGGMVAGCFETARRIEAIEKPTKAIADSFALSAGYALASACDEISLSDTAMVGSIGVVTMHVDFSKAMDEYGFKVTYIYAGKEKVDGNPYEPLPEDAKSRIQERINKTYDIFVDAVSGRRDMSPEEVRNTEAGVYSGNDAVSIGLADVVSDPTDSYAAFYESELIGSSDDKEDYAMPKADSKTAKPAEATNAGQEAAKGANEQEQETTQTQAAENTQVSDTEAKQAERQRISAIVNCDAADGRGKLANHLAFNTDMTVEEATAVLEASGKDAAENTETPKQNAGSKTPFDSAMDNSDNPNVGADDSAQDQQDKDASAQILADFQSATGYQYEH